jgi:hypothetical protein
MTATYTFHIFSSLEGFGSHNGNWAATWQARPRAAGSPPRLVQSGAADDLGSQDVSGVRAGATPAVGGGHVAQVAGALPVPANSTGCASCSEAQIAFVCPEMLTLILTG